MTNKKWTEAELQQIKGLGLPIKKTQRELELEQQVNTLTEALDNVKWLCLETRASKTLRGIHAITIKALQSIKESPREEQGDGKVL